MAAKGETSSTEKANRDFLLEIEIKVQKWWEEEKVRSNGKPGRKFFEKFPYNCLSELEWPPDFPIDALRFALAYVSDGPFDAAMINFRHGNANSVLFDAANAAILRLSEEMSWHNEFMVADFESWLRTGPPSTSADKVFANDMNIALNKTKQHYEACQFREALEFGFLALQDSRDWYKSLCGGTNEMNRDLVFRYMELQTHLISPICPHYSEYVWKEILHNVNFVAQADWPAADAPENLILQSIHKYLKDLTHSQKKQIENEGIKKVCPNIEVLIYVKEESCTLKVGDNEEVELWDQDLDLELPFRESRVLLQNLDVIKRQIGFESMQVLSASNAHDLERAGSHVELIKGIPPKPGRPITLILKRSHSLTTAKLGPSSSDCSPLRSITTMSKPKCSDEKAKQNHGLHGGDHIRVLDWFDKQSKRKHHMGETRNQGTKLTKGNKPLYESQSYHPNILKFKFKGSFNKAMDTACDQDKWLLVNLQCREDPSSHKLNQDTWAYEAISHIISTNFIFWQEYSDHPTGTAVSKHYKLDSRTVVIIIDPITGLKLRLWNGMVLPEDFLADVLPFLDGSPRKKQLDKEEEEEALQRALEASMNTKATEQVEEEELKRAFEASMESIKFERSTPSTLEEDIVPSFDTSLESTKVSEEVEEEQLRSLKAFVERMKLEPSIASTSKGAAEEEEQQRASAACMESESGSNSIVYPLEMPNIEPTIRYVTEGDEDLLCEMAEFVSSTEPSSASTSTVHDIVSRQEEDEKLQRALVGSSESLSWGTKKEEEEEDLHRAVAASMESMRRESSGSTPKQDLVPFVSRDEDEDLLRALAASVESFKSEKRTNPSI